MKIKKPILILGVMLLSLAAYANFSMANCTSILTLNVNAALSELTSDLQWCESNGGLLSGSCKHEAELSYNYNINNALAGYDFCCCSNGLGCCDP